MASRRSARFSTAEIAAGETGMLPPDAPLVETQHQAIRQSKLARHPRNLPFRVEMWDQSDQHIRWVIAASASVVVGHAAMDAAIANYPDQRFTLRNGILVIGSIREDEGDFCLMTGLVAIRAW